MNDLDELIAVLSALTETEALIVLDAVRDGSSAFTDAVNEFGTREYGEGQRDMVRSFDDTIESMGFSQKDRGGRQ